MKQQNMEFQSNKQQQINNKKRKKYHKMGQKGRMKHCTGKCMEV